jgi:cytochrome c oxidase subunit 3
MEDTAVIERLLGRNASALGEARFKEDSSLSVRSELPINRALLGLLIFLGTEAMFFAGLISAFLILRAGSGVWPPPGQPRLPVAVTAINTLNLLFSAYTMHRALQSIRAGNQKTLIAWLSLTGVLGAIFLGVQGSEWIRLVQHGLTFSSSIYGGIFYTLIGWHGLHVLVAVIVLFFVLSRVMSKRYFGHHYAGIELCRMYWFFVVGIWPVLYVLVYLS